MSCRCCPSGAEWSRAPDEPPPPNTVPPVRVIKDSLSVNARMTKCSITCESQKRQEKKTFSNCESD